MNFACRFLPPSSCLLLALVGDVTFAPSLRAANTWVGAGSSNKWSDVNNWDNGRLPSTDAPLVFNGAARPVNINNRPAATVARGLTFESGASSFSLSGQSLTLTGDILVKSGPSAVHHHIQLPLIFDANRVVRIVGVDNALTLSGPISETGGARSLVKTSEGRLVLSANNLFSGITAVQLGVVEVSSLTDGTLPSPLGLGTSVRLGAGPNTGELLYRGAGHTTDRQVQIGLGTNATDTGGAVLTAEGTGPMVWSAARFNLTAIPGPTTGSITRTLTLGGGSVAKNRIDGVVADSSPTVRTAVVKAGTGQWSLGAVQAYTGPTEVRGGTLVVDGSMASSQVTVQSGATLQAAGPLAGSLTVAGGARLQFSLPATPTATPLLRVAGAVTLSTAATFALGVDAPPAGGSYPLLVAEGGITQNGVGVLSLSSDTPASLRGKLRVSSDGKTLYYDHPLLVSAYYPWYTTPEGPGAALDPWGSWHWKEPRVGMEIDFRGKYTPLAGFYHSNDPRVADWHARLAKAAGIDAFMISWWSAQVRLDAAENAIIPALEKHGVRFALFDEMMNVTPPLSDPSDPPGVRGLPEDADFTLYKTRMAAWVKKYRSSNAYLRIDGRPVVYIYQVSNRRNLSVARFEELKKYVDTNAADGDDTAPVYWIVDTLQHDGRYVLEDHRCKKFIPDWLNSSLDGCSFYSLFAEGLSSEATQPVALFNRLSYLRDQTYTKGKKLLAPVHPGFRNPNIPHNEAIPRQTADQFSAQLTAHRDAGVDITMITSWNEWPESTTIEPAVSQSGWIDPYLYLKLLAEFQGKTFILPNKAPIAPPELTAPPAVAGRAYRYVLPSWAFSDPDGDRLTFRLVSAPAWMSLQQDGAEWVVTGTPPRAGSLPVVVSVSARDFDQAEATVKFTVNVPRAHANATLTFNTNRATGTVPAALSYAPGSTAAGVTLPGNTGLLERTGFVFLGWNTAADGSGQRYLPGSTYDTPVSATLYAQWGPSTLVWSGQGTNTKWSSRLNWNAGQSPDATAVQSLEFGPTGLLGLKPSNDLGSEGAPAMMQDLVFTADAPAYNLMGTRVTPSSPVTPLQLAGGIRWKDGAAGVLAEQRVELPLVLPEGDAHELRVPAGARLTLAGRITGTRAQVRKTGEGDLVIAPTVPLSAGVFAYSGLTTIEAGRLLLTGTQSSQLVMPSLRVTGSGRVDLNGFDFTTVNLEGESVVENRATTPALLSVGSTSLAGEPAPEFTGRFEGALSVRKFGSGRWVLRDNARLPGGLTVENGQLDLRGDLRASRSSVLVKGPATLGGDAEFGGDVEFEQVITATGIIQSPFLEAKMGSGLPSLRVKGTLRIPAALNFRLLVPAVLPAGTYTLVEASGGIFPKSGFSTNVISILPSLPRGFTRGQPFLDATGTRLQIAIWSTNDRYRAWINGRMPNANATWASDFEADFDNDGLSNGVEYALGTDPTRSTPAPSLVKRDDGVWLEITKGSDATSDSKLTYGFESSSDLRTWTAVNPTIPNTMRYRLPDGQNKLFVRLRVTRQP